MAERLFLDIARVAITDDRGETRTVPFIDIIGPPRGYANTPSPQALKHIRWTVLRRNWFAGLLLGGSVSLAATLVFASMLISPTVRGSSMIFGLLMIAAMPPLALIYSVTALPLFRKLYRPAYLDATWSLRLCPFCFYDLSHTEAAHDHLVCPECAGAWRVDRFPAEPADTSLQA